MVESHENKEAKKKKPLSNYKNKYNKEDLIHNFLFDDLTRIFPDYEIETEVKDKLLIKATARNDVKSIEFSRNISSLCIYWEIIVFNQK